MPSQMLSKHTDRNTFVERNLPIEKKNRFRSRAIASQALLLAVLLALICLSGCGDATLGVRIEPTAAPTQDVSRVDQEVNVKPTVAPTQAVSRVDDDVRDAKHAKTDTAYAAAPAVDLPAKVEEPAVTPTPVVEETRPSETVSLDETWNRYTNYDLGFLLKVPKTMVSYNGACIWNKANDDRSYRPKLAFVPVKIFEGADSVTIAPEYLYELSGATTETNDQGGSRTLFAECNQVPNSPALLQDPERPWFSAQMWKIVAAEVHSDDELDALIKSRYGSGCGSKEKEATGQDGVYRVRIQGDGKDLSETLCPLNYATVVMYYPEGSKLIAWDLGQAGTFIGALDFTVHYDREMVESFRFLTETPTAAPSPTVDADLGTYTNDEYD
jgi:hypothetical protein